MPVPLDPATSCHDDLVAMFEVGLNSKFGALVTSFYLNPDERLSLGFVKLGKSLRAIQNFEIVTRGTRLNFL